MYYNIAPSVLIGSSSFLQLTRKQYNNNNKAWMSSNLCQVRPRTAELAANERLIKSYRLTMGEILCPCLHFSGSSSFLQVTRTTIKA